MIVSMVKRNTQVFFVLLLLFVVAVFIVLPIGKGWIGGRGVQLGLDLQGGTHMVYQADFSSVAPADQTSALDGVVEVLRNRIDPLGVSEPVIQKQGEDRIVVELPGKAITDEQKQSLASVAILEFGEQAADNETAKWEDALGRWKPATATVNGVEKELTSSYFNQNTYVNVDNLGRIHLVFNWDKDGSDLSREITTRMLNKPLGIFEGDRPLLGEDGRPIAPIVQAVITSSGEITGLTRVEAERLSAQLNAGRLPVPLSIIYDQTISPILGADFVDMSVKAGLVGVAVIMLFMTLYYRIPGLLSSIALAFYAAIVLALFKLIPVTLSLAGLGGFIVSLGMAVDANVLIFERMKEELFTGRTLGAAIEAGFDRAWSAIRDANLTTIMATVILYWLGSSVVASAPVQGFAVTLTIGVLVSMFTAITVTRTLLRLFIHSSIAQRTWLFSPRVGGK